MNKEKLIKGGVWLSGFAISIMFSAISDFLTQKVALNNVLRMSRATILLKKQNRL